MKFHNYYKEICRRIHKLPFDKKSMFHLQQKAKHEFILKPTKQYLYSSIDAKKFKTYIDLLDDFLIEENYDSLELICDYTYKSPAPQTKWINDFLNANYMSFKKSWPQVHLINEFAKGKVKEIYNHALNIQKPYDFSLVETLNLANELKGKENLFIKPINENKLELNNNTEDELKNVLKNLNKLQEFLQSNQGLLTKNKIRDFEIVYIPNKHGLPLGSIQTHKIYKKHITYFKKLVQQFRPINYELLNHLINFASSDGPEINDNFFRYMTTKYQNESKTLSPKVRTYLRKKHYVPNDKSIRDFFKEYSKKQFYIDEENQYQMSWLKYFINPHIKSGYDLTKVGESSRTDKYVKNSR